ncbi:hypothetical protein F183_A41260 [Bryobacterales bacterium F-183]|nr:hypothetical protein F183_A41260 [Bryobacterales bacterium F-183]
MKTGIVLCIAAAAASLSLTAQTLDLTHLDRLSSKTDQVVNISLDESLIRLAGAFLKGGGKEVEEVRNILPGIRGITVRSYEFDADNIYSKADVDKIEQQLKGWSTVVEVREGKKQETTRIMIKPGNREVGGLVVLSAAPRSLTVVNIAGTLSAEQLEKLSGHLGIPEIDVKKPGSDGGKKKPAQEEEEEE